MAYVQMEVGKKYNVFTSKDSAEFSGVVTKIDNDNDGDLQITLFIDDVVNQPLNQVFSIVYEQKKVYKPGDCLKFKRKDMHVIPVITATFFDDRPNEAKPIGSSEKIIKAAPVIMKKGESYRVLWFKNRFDDMNDQDKNSYDNVHFEGTHIKSYMKDNVQYADILVSNVIKSYKEEYAKEGEVVTCKRKDIFVKRLNDDDGTWYGNDNPEEAALIVE